MCFVCLFRYSHHHGNSGRASALPTIVILDGLPFQAVNSVVLACVVVLAVLGKIAPDRAGLAARPASRLWVFLCVAGQPGKGFAGSDNLSGQCSVLISDSESCEIAPCLRQFFEETEFAFPSCPEGRVRFRLAEYNFVSSAPRLLWSAGQYPSWPTVKMIHLLGEFKFPFSVRVSVPPGDHYDTVVFA